MMLTKNFSLKEFLISQTAIRRGFLEQIQPPDKIIDRLEMLCKNVLQPVRDALPKGVIKVTSGYRCKRLNDAVGSNDRSDHLHGMAADLEYYEGGVEKNLILYEKIIELDLPFKQLIKEYGTEENPNWIHVSYDPKDVRKQILRIK